MTRLSRMHSVTRLSLCVSCLMLAVCAAGQRAEQDPHNTAASEQGKIRATSAGSPDMPTSKPRGKGQKIGLREYLKERGRVQDIPKALVIYEFAFLALAYVVEPTKNGILGPLRRFTEGSRFQQLQQAAARRLGWLGRSLNLDGVRLATSYAECSVIRLVCKPLLVPLKLYLTWNGLLFWNKEKDSYQAAASDSLHEGESK